jgi:AraC-like DNA-binding protein
MRASAVAAALRLVGDAGHDPTSLLDRVGLTPADVRDGDEWLTLRHVAALYEAGAQLLSDEAFGLHVGLAEDLRELGVLSYVVLNSSTVGAALRNLERYFRVFAQGVEVRLDARQTLARLTFGVDDPQVWPRRQFVEDALAYGCKLLSALSDAAWWPTAVHFEHPAPADRSTHQAVFGRALLFDQPTNALLFDRAWLEHAVPRADRRLLEVVEEHVRAMLAAQPTEDDLVRLLRDQIARSVCDGPPSRSNMARQLAMSERTLQRRLAERGFGFKQLVEITRRELAVRYVKDPGTELTEVAFLLGYSELSAFDRAFRRWTGLSPLEYRRRGRAASDVPPE